MDVTPRTKTVWNIFGTRVTITKQYQVKSMCRYLELQAGSIDWAYQTRISSDPATGTMIFMSPALTITTQGAGSSTSCSKLRHWYLSIYTCV